MPTNLELIQAKRTWENQQQGRTATAQGIQSNVRKEQKQYQAVTGQNNTDIEIQVNSPDYPAELKVAYQSGKTTGNFNTFNAAVDQYNAAQKAKAAQAQATRQAEIASLETNVNSPDYPAELRAAYQKSKQVDDFTEFNSAVDRYNADQRTQYQKARAEYQKQEAEYNKQAKEYAEAAVESSRYAAAHPYSPAPMTPEEQQAFNEFYLSKPTEAEFKQFVEDHSNYVPVGTLNNPEYILKADYNKIKLADKENGTNLLQILKDTGVTGLNATITNYNEKIRGENARYEQEYKDYQSQQAEFEKTINSPDYPEILRWTYNKGKETGDFTKFNDAIDSWNASVDKKIKEFNKNYHVVNGEGILKSDWEKLSQDDKDIIDQQGFQAYVNKYRQIDYYTAQDQALFDSTMKQLAPYKDKDGNYNLVNYFVTLRRGEEQSLARRFTDKEGNVDIAAYNNELARLTEGNKDLVDYDHEIEKLTNAGFDTQAVKDAIYYSKLNAAQKYWQASTPWNEAKGEKASVKGVSIMAAEFFVPGVYTARHWKEMTTTAKVFNLLFDVATVFAPAGRGAVEGGRSVAGFATRAGVMNAAAKGFARGAAAGALGTVEVILHPVGAAKATVADVRNFAENVVSGKKIPGMAVYTSDGTLRFKINDSMSTAQWVAMRDSLMKAARDGKRVYFQMGDKIVEIRRSPLMQELPGSLTHTTPQGDRFIPGTTIKLKYDRKGNLMPEKEQGLFLAPDALPRFARQGAFGGTGELPTIFITSPKTAQAAIETGKVYKSAVGPVVEGELKLKVAENTEAVGQRLYTRIGPDNFRVEILLEGDTRLSAKQIAKLKAKALIETIGAPFTPAIKWSRSGLTTKEVKELSNVLAESGGRAEARNLMRAAKLLNSGRAAATPAVVFRAGENIRDIESNMRGERVASNVPRNQPPIKGSIKNQIVKAPREFTREELQRYEELKKRGSVVRINREGQRITYTAEPARMPFPVSPDREALARDMVEKKEKIKTPRKEGKEKDKNERVEINVETKKRAVPDRVVNETSANITDIRVNRVPPFRDNAIIRTPNIELPREGPPPRTPPPRRIPPPTPPPPPVPPPDKSRGKKTGKGKSDKEKRAIIKERGLTTYNMGKLHGKDVWWTHLDTGENVVVLGEKPEGAKLTADGKGSADKTTQRIGTQRNFPAFSIRHGAVMSHVTPAKGSKGATAKFGPSSPSAIGRSHKVGKMYVTELGSSKVLGFSKKPLGRRRRKR